MALWAHLSSLLSFLFLFLYLSPLSLIAAAVAGDKWPSLELATSSD